MRVLTVDPHDPAPAVLREAVAALSRGGIVAYPTDTLYGLAVDPRDERAVDRLFAAKGRGFDQPLPLIAGDESQVSAQAGELTPLARRLAAAFWPGPLTLILPANAALARRVHASSLRVAVRVPDHATARALARDAGHPLTATSANLSGSAAASTAAEIVAALGDRVDVLLDAGPTAGGLPSTIVDATGAAPVLIRPGVVPWERVLEFLK